MDRAWLREARTRMRRHGVFVQGVLGSPPFDEPYVYSTGFQLLDPPRPEVICFGLDVPSASSLVNQVFRRVRDGTAPLEPGSLLGRFDGFDEALNVRVDPVLPCWAESYALASPVLLGREPDAVPFVQLVWPDRQGRWPEELDVNGCLPHHEPLLSRDPAWLLPVCHTPKEDRFFDQAGGVSLVALPVYRHLRPEGRYELVAATLLDERSALIGQVPWLADHVAFGDVVAVTPAADVGAGKPLLGEGFAGAFRGGALLRSGGYRTLAYAARGRSQRVWRRIVDVVGALSADPGKARASTTAVSLHVNTRQPDEVRAALRPFVRDGHLAESGPRSGPPEVPDHPLGACQTCQDS